MSALLIGALWTVPVGVAIGSAPNSPNRAAVGADCRLHPCHRALPGDSPLPHPPPRRHAVGAMLLILLGTQWYILFNVIAGAMAIPTDLKEAAKIFHSDVGIAGAT